MVIDEGARTQKLVEILEYGFENGIKVREIPYISEELKMSKDNLYSLVGILVEIRMLELDKKNKVYKPNEKAERFLKGYYRVIEETSAQIPRLKA